MEILKFPLARTTIAFVLGIIYCSAADLSPVEVIAAALITSPILILLYIMAKRHSVQNIYFAVAVFAMSFIVGISTHVVHDEQRSKNLYTHLIDSTDKTLLIQATICEKLKPTKNNQRYVAIVDNVNKGKTTGKILINIDKSTTSSIIVAGTIVRFRTKVFKHGKPLNPYQFDYGRYLRNKGIYAQVYLNASELELCAGPQISIWYYSGLLRDRIITNLQKSGFQARELAVLSALILGQQQDIPKDVLRDYQYAGAVHILSVSGLHVGFILLFINFLLSPLPHTKKYSWIRISIVLVSLWGFAILAGMSPSVVRSVTMFSFVAIGMHIRRTTNIFHTLLVSIFLILLFEPNFLFDVGFQLSYLALFFILWLQPQLAAIWHPKYKVIKYFWDILTVSFAAQLGALPLSIYYFHQFPGLFFVTNIVVIPFLSVLMALGVIVMILAALNLMVPFLMQILQHCITLLNSTVSWIASNDQFVITDIPFPYQTLVTSYVLICALVLWYQHPDFKKAVGVLLSILFFQISYIYVLTKFKSEAELLVLDVRGKTFILERNGQELTVYRANQTTAPFDESIINTYKVATFSRAANVAPIQNLLFHNNKKIMLIDSSTVHAVANPDILILTQSPKINLNRLIQDVRPKTIVADGSNYKTYIALWKQSCTKHKILFHATGEKGFYKVN